MSKFQVGDHVRVKQRGEIILTSEKTSLSGLNFAHGMEVYCGRDFVLQSSTHKDFWFKFGWWWDEDWLESYEQLPDDLEIDKLL